MPLSRRTGTAMTRLGYARVSSTEQDTALQIQDLKAAGCERIYRDHGVSGTRTSRPELDKMLDRLSRGTKLSCGSWTDSDAPRATSWNCSTTSRAGHQVPLAARWHCYGPRHRVWWGHGPGDGHDHLGLCPAGTGPTIGTNEGWNGCRCRERPIAGRRQVTAGHDQVKRALELKAQGLRPADIGKVIGVSRATVYRYLSLARGEPM